jgi:hypothetical protein
MSDTSLFLHEEVMLLALRDQKGTVYAGSMYQFAIGGAVISELLLNNRLSIEERRFRKLVDVVNASPLGDPLLDETLQKIRLAKRRASLENWVSRIANIRKLKHRVVERLCWRGILREDVGKVLLIFKRKIYPELNPAPERAMLSRLENAIFTDTSDIDPRTIVLLSLAHSSDLLKMSFDKKHLKERKKRIKQLISGEIVGAATREAIAAMQAGMTVAAIMPAIIASTTVSSSS